MRQASILEAKRKKILRIQQVVSCVKGTERAEDVRENLLDVITKSLTYHTAVNNFFWVESGEPRLPSRGWRGCGHDDHCSFKNLPGICKGKRGLVTQGSSEIGGEVTSEIEDAQTGMWELDMTSRAKSWRRPVGGHYSEGKLR